MKPRVKIVLLSLTVIAALIAGCMPGARTTPTPTVTATPTPVTNETGGPLESPDAQTTASIVDNEAAFEQAMSKNGTWIICALKDFTFTKDIVLEGEYKNGKKDDNGNDIIQRKIALYTQDENRNVTARFTLTAPTLTILSPNARIQSGTFKGDLIVSASNFELVDAIVEGNVYFTTDQAKNTFKMDEKSRITGKQEMKK